jgi:hypothetical protein
MCHRARAISLLWTKFGNRSIPQSSAHPKRSSRPPATTIPRTVFWGLIVPLIIGICSGSAYMAVLSMTVARQGADQVANQTAMNVRIAALESRVDGNKDASTTKVDSINDRLTRMEAQLSFLVKTSEAKK